MEKYRVKKGWFFFEDDGVNFRQKGKAADEEHALLMLSVFFLMLPKKMRDHLRELDENDPEVRELIDHTERKQWSSHDLN